jgi:hypothetical protein
MKNFTAFVFKPNDIEKLQKYIEEKAIPEPQYAYAFFGAFNGFASMSKDFTKSLVSNKIVQIELDRYFHNIQNSINQIIVFFRAETDNMFAEEGLSYQEIMDNSDPIIFSTEIAEETEINQDTTKIDLQELKYEILLKVKREKIVSSTVQDEFEEKLNNSMMEINKILAGLPYKGQLEFSKKRLLLLFTTKYKVKGLGEQKLKKLFTYD